MKHITRISNRKPQMALNLSGSGLVGMILCPIQQILGSIVGLLLNPTVYVQNAHECGGKGQEETE